MPVQLQLNADQIKLHHRIATASRFGAACHDAKAFKKPRSELLRRPHHAIKSVIISDLRHSSKPALPLSGQPSSRSSMARSMPLPSSSLQEPPAAAVRRPNSGYSKQI